MWKNSIYIYVTGKRPYYVHLNAYIKCEWNPKGKWDVYSRENGFFIIKFELEDDCTKVINGGPWFIDSKLIFMIKWEANFSVSKRHAEFLSYLGTNDEAGLGPMNGKRD